MNDSFDRLQGVKARMRELEGRSFVNNPSAQSEYHQLSQTSRRLHREAFPDAYREPDPSPIYPNREMDYR